MEFDSQEIKESFALEVAEHIQRANECLMLMEKSDDEEAINGLFRMLHTIKGNALMLGYDQLGKFAHSAESLVAKLRNKQITADKSLIDLLFKVLDTLESMTCLLMDNPHQLVDVEDLIDQLNAITGANAATQPTQAPTPGITIFAADTSDGNPGQPPRRGGWSILVVDDEYIPRRQLVELLRPFGSCDIAADGQEALAAFSGNLETQPYDLVFLDVMMPKLDGFEAAKRMRSLEVEVGIRRLRAEGACRDGFSKRDAVIVVTSVLDDPEQYIKACYQCGADTYLVKPVSAEAINGLMTSYASLLAR